MLFQTSDNMYIMKRWEIIKPAAEIAQSRVGTGFSYYDIVRVTLETPSPLSRYMLLWCLFLAHVTLEIVPFPYLLNLRRFNPLASPSQISSSCVEI